MDYGQPKNGSKVTGIFSGSDQFTNHSQSTTLSGQFQSEMKENPYFTAGAGNMSPEANDFEPENNLDEENWQRSLEISTPVNLPSPEDVRSKTENQTTLNTINSDNLTLDGSTELGRIVSTDYPSKTTSVPDSQNTSLNTTATVFNPTNIRTTGDRLEKSAIPEVDNVINELNQTGNLNNFYEEIRGTGDEKLGMLGANLNNSFNRKLGHEHSIGGSH